MSKLDKELRKALQLIADKLPPYEAKGRALVYGGELLELGIMKDNTGQRVNPKARYRTTATQPAPNVKVNHLKRLERAYLLGGRPEVVKYLQPYEEFLRPPAADELLSDDNHGINTMANHGADTMANHGGKVTASSAPRLFVGGQEVACATLTFEEQEEQAVRSLSSGVMVVGEQLPGLLTFEERSSSEGFPNGRAEMDAASAAPCSYPACGLRACLPSCSSLSTHK